MATPQPDFARRLVDWQRTRGRHDLPWQNTRDPYRIWLSEIMLQQTQVATVIPYYERFLARFPTLTELAAASIDDVLALWSGLGYYSRARNLHQAAGMVEARYGGHFPPQPEDIAQLPGVGRSTAAAIAAFAFGTRAAILDGNVKRVLTRHFAIEGFPGAAPVERKLWALAEALSPARDIEAYTQGIMDLGATVCVRSRPDCGACPVAATCVALSQGRVAELPEPRARKPVPQRHTVMLMLLHGRDVFLEKRAPAGVWGGLWSFPEIAPDEDPVLAVHGRFGLRATPAAPWPAFEHTFSHFRLSVTPQPMRVASTPGAAEPGGVWIALEDALQAAIPKPVRDLLGRLAAEPA